MPKPAAPWVDLAFPPPKGSWGPLDLMLLPSEYVRVYAPGGSNIDDRGLGLKGGMLRGITN
jgi:hypothetical protein